MKMIVRNSSELYLPGIDVYNREGKREAQAIFQQLGGLLAKAISKARTMRQTRLDRRLTRVRVLCRSEEGTTGDKGSKKAVSGTLSCWFPESFEKVGNRDATRLLCRNVETGCYWGVAGR